MSISGINAGISPAKVNPSIGKDASSQIKALEQKIQQLNQEKEKAVKSKNEEAKKKIERQIQEIRKQIERLQGQEGKKQEVEQSAAATQGSKTKDSLLGNYVDEMI